MTIQKLLITAGAITLLAATATTPAGARSAASQPTPVTFSRAVELPGITLPAGAYIFERANPETAGDVTLVRSKTGHVQWLGLTNRVERRNGNSAAVQVSEARQGEAPRVLAWFPTGSLTGAAFIY